LAIVLGGGEEEEDDDDDDDKSQAFGVVAVVDFELLYGCLS
jgi:hypothetical protein